MTGYWIDLPTSRAVRAWMEDEARKAVPDREAVPQDPNEMSDAELLAQYPRPGLPRNPRDEEARRAGEWLEGLADSDWVGVLRVTLAIIGGWPLPAPRVWFPTARMNAEEWERWRAGEPPHTEAGRRWVRALARDKAEREAALRDLGIAPTWSP